jgi:hypothetical protein
MVWPMPARRRRAGGALADRTSRAEHAIGQSARPSVVAPKQIPGFLVDAAASRVATRNLPERRHGCAEAADGDRTGTPFSVSRADGLTAQSCNELSELEAAEPSRGHQTSRSNMRTIRRVSRQGIEIVITNQEPAASAFHRARTNGGLRPVPLGLHARQRAEAAVGLGVSRRQPRRDNVGFGRAQWPRGNGAHTSRSAIYVRIELWSGCCTD